MLMLLACWFACVDCSTPAEAGLERVKSEEVCGCEEFVLPNKDLLGPPLGGGLFVCDLIDL